MQCRARDIPVGPISTYRGWQALGRQVRKGERALTLCMPVTYKKTVRGDDGKGTEEARQRFIYRRNWFVVSQTDGDDVQAQPIPGWDLGAALTALNVERIPFEALDGNTQGYARGQAIAINPVATMREKTTLHELAHGEFVISFSTSFSLHWVNSLSSQKSPAQRSVLVRSRTNETRNRVFIETHLAAEIVVRSIDPINSRLPGITSPPKRLWPQQWWSFHERGSLRSPC